MGTIQIGRVSLDDNVTLGDLRAVRERGNNVTLTGQIKEQASVDDRQYLRRELLAMDPKRFGREMVVPVVYDTDSSIDGFYVVKSVDVSIDSGNAPLIGGAVGVTPFNVQLESMGDVVFESRKLIFTLPNDHSHVGGNPFIGMPADAFFTFPAGTFIEREVEGAVEEAQILTISTAAMQSQRIIFGTVPADYFNGAASIYINGLLRSGVHSVNYGGGDPTEEWVLINGGFRILGTTSHRFSIAVWDGSAWSTAKLFDLQTSGSQEVWSTIEIVRNDPEVVSIKLSAARGVQGRGYQSMIITLRRGSRIATVNYWNDLAGGTIKIVRDSSETSVTTDMSSVGIRASANDGDGDQFVLGSRSSHTTDLSNGGITFTAVKAADCFVGLALDGSTAISGDAPADLVDQYIEQVAEDVVPIPVRAIA